MGYREDFLKRLLFLVPMALALLPQVTKAQGWPPPSSWPPPPRHHWRVNANEMAAAGFALAGMIGIAGYLALRHRKTT